VPVSVQDSAASVLTRYGHLSGRAFEAAVRYEAQPVGTPLCIATIRELLGVGAHIGARVLRELIAAGLAVGRRIQDAATGRMLGRRTDWAGPDAPGSAGKPQQADPAERALALLSSLAAFDKRLTFRERDLRTLVPFVLARFETGATPEDLRRELTADLPTGRIKSGLLRYRLGRRPAVRIPAQQSIPRLVECADCRRPARGLTPGALCADCRPATDPVPLSAVVADADTLTDLTHRPH
jgi:hypothetical protein